MVLVGRGKVMGETAAAKPAHLRQNVGVQEGKVAMRAAVLQPLAKLANKQWSCCGRMQCHRPATCPGFQPEGLQTLAATLAYNATQAQKYHSTQTHLRGARFGIASTDALRASSPHSNRLLVLCAQQRQQQQQAGGNSSSSSMTRYRHSSSSSRTSSCTCCQRPNTF
jgi:hypothetical protein